MASAKLTFHRWKGRYDGMSQSELAKAKHLEDENARLKRLLAERDLEIDAIKAVLTKKAPDGRSSRASIPDSRA